MKNSWKIHLKNPGIFFKILIVFEIVLLATVIAVSSYIIRRFTDKMLEKEILLGEMNLEKLADFGRDKYNRIYSLYNYIHSGDISEVIVNAAENAEDAYKAEDIKKVNAFFAGVLSADSDISDVILCSTSGVVYSQSAEGYQDVKPSYAFFSDPVIKDFAESEESMKIVYSDPSPYTLKKRDPVISFLGKIFDPGSFPQRKLVGIFIMNIPLEKFQKEDFASRVSVEGELILINADNRIVFSTLEEQWGKDYMENPSGEEEEEYRSIKEVGTSGMKAVYTLPNKALYNEVTEIRSQIYKMVAGAILLTLVMYFAIYRIFNRQMKVIIRSMEQLQQGRFDLRIPVESRDELGIISKAFNEMCEKLNVYVSQVYSAEIQRKNAELNALQMQIDPHFLYNTLESIRTRALEEGAEDTAEMIVLLGELFRWNMRTKDKFITLEIELEYIETYLKLQKYRYDDKLEVEIKVEEKCLDDIVPKLILQPLIENVIIHAFREYMEKGIIGITVKEKNSERLEITVFDNGVGINEKKLYEMNERLRRGTGQDDFNSIGLQNVQARIKLLYGDAYGLKINSIDGMGTAVKVILPIIKEGDVQTCTDCLL